MKLTLLFRYLGIFLALLMSSFVLPQGVLAVVYQPGETLNPACTPSDTSCYVQPPITGSAASSTFQTPAVFLDVITISATSTPGVVSSRLYNVGGVLYWNGSAVAGAIGLTSLNGISSSTQTFAIGTTGTDILVVSTSSVHTFNIPNAGASARGVVSTSTQTFAGEKTFSSTTTLATTTTSNFTVTGTSTLTWVTAARLYLGSLTGILTAENGLVGTSSLLSFLAYASTTADGILSTTTQSFAGEKTFTASTTLATTTIARLIASNGLQFSSLVGGLLQTNASGDVATTSLAALTTNALSWLGNTLTSTVNGVATTTQISYANGTTDGIISTTTQTFAGGKTFTSTTTLATTTTSDFTVTGTSTLAWVAAARLYLGSLTGILTASDGLVGTSSILSLLPYASTTADGIISTTTQTFAGSKTFSGTLTLATTTASGLTLSQNGLTIASSTPTATSSVLYNLANTLYWNGAEVLTGGLVYGGATGWLTGGTISINSGDTTKLDITAGSARIVNMSNPLSPDIKTITWGNQTALDPSLTGRSKWIGVQNDGSGNAQFVYDSNFDSTERRSTAILGRIWSTTGAGPTITNVAGYTRPAWGILTAFQDFVLEFGSWNISGNLFSANGANLLLDKSAGTSYRYNAESTYGQENVHTDIVRTGITTYNYHIQGSSVTYATSTLQPGVYNSSSLATSTVANLKFTRQEIYFFPVSGTIHVLYGQTEYNSIALAEEAGPEGVDAVNLDILDGSIHRATIIMKGNTTVLTDDAKVKIINHASGIGGAQSFSGFWSSGSSSIYFAESGQNVGIGTSSPARKLHVVTSVNEPPVRFEDSNGYCEIDPTSILMTCTSDARLKTNIVSVQNTLTNILALNPVNFDWRNEVGDGIDGVRGSRYGLIAQEVEDIFPYLVETDVETGLKSVAYGGLTIPMLKALQEIATIASSTAGLTLVGEDGIETKTFLGQFLDSMVAWFADSTNGIGKFFADGVDTKELCLTDRDGTSCYSRSEFNAALQSMTVQMVSDENNTSNVTTPLDEEGQEVTEDENTEMQGEPISSEEESVETVVEEETETPPEQAILESEPEPEPETVTVDASPTEVQISQ